MVVNNWLENKIDDIQYDKIACAIAKGISYNDLVELVDGLPSKFKTLQNKISKTDTLLHDCINLMVCIVDSHHDSISERVILSILLKRQHLC